MTRGACDYTRSCARRKLGLKSFIKSSTVANDVNLESRSLLTGSLPYVVGFNKLKSSRKQAPPVDCANIVGSIS